MTREGDLARYVRVDDGPGAGTFAIVAILVLIFAGAAALVIIPIFLVAQVIWRLWRGQSPAEALRPIGMLLAGLLFYALIH